ncbi:hypothetical protein K469DRAFT_778124, partial [Zopfia rhizophila CBS 207.26]
MKMAQISRMDSVYKWSKFTIIAASGEDAQYGFPVVSTRRRLPRPSVDIDGHTLLATLPGLHAFLQDSKWSTRAWIYQERFFSNLCLIFTDYQVFYKCQGHGGYQCESTTLALVPPNRLGILTGQLVFPILA